MKTSLLKRRLTGLFGLLMLTGMHSVAADTPAPQVLIESKIIEVDDSFTKDIGTGLDGLNSCLEQGALQRQSLGPKPSFAETTGASMASGLMGSLLGGGISGGLGAGPGGDSGPDHTFLSKNTLKDALSPSFPFLDGSTIQLQFQPSLHEPAPDIGFMDEDDYSDYSGGSSTPSKPVPGSLIGIRINEGPVKDQGFSFTDAVLVGPDCKRHPPSGRLIYEVWQETTFSWSIEYWRWRNGALVEHWLKLGSESWSELLAKGDLPLWVGMRFDGITPDMLAEGGWSLVTGWTYESDGEIIIQPRVFDLVPPTTTVMLGDGKRVAIGGLTEGVKDTKAGKVPMLGDIPMVGRLFGDAGSEQKKNELLMFITPKIINPVE